MATISENLQTIKDSVDAIKQAIIDKGGNITGDISTWADTINELSGGGAGSVFKITNKLNGYQFGGPSYTGTITHTYEFEGGTLGSNTVIVNYNPEYEGYEIFPNDNCNHSSLSLGTVGFYTSQLCRYGFFKCYCSNFGVLTINSMGTAINNNPLYCPCIYIAFDTNGNYDFDFFYFLSELACFLKNTRITMFDNSIKLIQDITYNDELLVWNFDEGKYDKAKPLWIKKELKANYYYKVVFDNNTILNLVGSNGKCHRIFSIEDGMFISATDMVGKTTYTETGVSRVISCECIEETCEYYNIITNHHINLFANGVLTSCRYNNIYPIENMKFIKDNRLKRAPKWKLYELFKDYRVLDKYIEGLRLYEQINIPLEDTINYCQNLENLRKNLDDFEDNVNLINNIEESEVGWIDRNGKVYGFKLYMSGLLNHIILSEKICKLLNIETNNPSRYLEKLGWVKYTTDFILSSNDEIINDNLLNTIKKFINSNKLKTPGKIRIGYFNSPQIDISEFEKMDIYSFEYRKHINLK